MKVIPELYHVTISSSASWKATEEQFLQEQEKFKGHEIFVLTKFNPEDEYGQKLIEDSADGVWVLSGDNLLALAVSSIPFQVKSKIDVSVNISQQLAELAERPIKIVSEQGGTNNYNTKCEVHMPGQALSMYNDVLLLEDSCTDVLHEHLQGGWRIIAACPQPDQRRPDYILGRFNLNIDRYAMSEFNRMFSNNKPWS